MNVFALAFTFFLIINPIGNSPAFITLVKDFPIERQNRILFRECIFALILAYFFLFLGEWALGMLQLETYTIGICGGIILFLVAMDLIFPKTQLTHASETVQKREPFFVPIATPLLSGPCFMTTLMLKAAEEPSTIRLALGIFLAWLATCAVVMLAPAFQRLFGNRGLVALEQLMGMVLTFISLEMFFSGIRQFVGSV